MGWIERKRMILNRIVILVNDSYKLYGLKTVKEKLIAYLGAEFGTSRRKALEYINTLITTGHLTETWDSDGTYYHPMEKSLIVE